MSTHSTISVCQKDGSVKTIYCHFDGYISYTGKLLLESYSTEELANRLVDFGDILSIKDNIEKVEQLNDEFNQQVFDSENDFKNTVQLREYNYIFKDNMWLLVDGDPHSNCYIKFSIYRPSV